MPMQRPNTNCNGLVRGEQAPRRMLQVILVVTLVAATFAAYSPAISAGFIWDDDVQLYNNPLIKASDGLYRFWFTTEAQDYWPLTSTTMWLEWRTWGDHPRPYHLANIALHAAAAVLLWRVLRRLNLNEPAAYLAGLIFAIHPVTAASVAWITERKNVLSMVLYLLAILAFLRFEDHGRRRWYVFAVLAAAAALLAKASVAMLPLILLLCAWWRRGSLTRRDVLRTIPFFTLSLVLGLVTVWFQRHQAVSVDVARPEGLASRIAASGWIVWFYLYKTLLPINLAMVYPRWAVDGRRFISFVPLGLLIACFASLWHYRRSWGRAPLAALGYFVITLLPVLGFINMSFAKYSLVADHLQYVSMIGVIALASALLASPLSRTGVPGSSMIRRVGLAVVCAVVLTLGTLTWRQAWVYKDKETLWTYEIQLNDRAWVAFNNRGNAYLGRSAYEQAIADYTRALELKSDYAYAWYNCGLARGQIGDYDGAIRDCTKAIELNPQFEEAYAIRGNAYFSRKIYGPAVLDYTEAIKLRPDDIFAYYNRGLVYAGLDDHVKAIGDYSRVIELKPDAVEVYPKRAVSYYHLKQYDNAWADVQAYKRRGGTPDPGFVQALMQATSRSE